MKPSGHLTALPRSADLGSHGMGADRHQAIDFRCWDEAVEVPSSLP
jgi:hypothetical protein